MPNLWRVAHRRRGNRGSINGGSGRFAAVRSAANASAQNYEARRIAASIASCRSFLSKPGPPHALNQQQLARIAALTANTAKPSTKNSNIALIGDLPSAVCCCCTASVSSTARAKDAIGRLDFHFTIVLRARGEPEFAARGLNNRAARPFV